MATLKVTNSFIRATADKLKVLFSSKYLLYTNTTICIGLSCTADSLQQHLQIKKREIPRLNLRRSRDVAVTGLLIGPFCHYWYILLDKWLPGKTLRIVAKKIAFDQIICSPIVIGMFLWTTLYLEGKKGTNLKTEMIDKGKTLYVADWVIWPPAQAFNFFFLPTRYRVLYDNVISFVFDWYFSYVKYDKAHNCSVCDTESSDLNQEQAEHAIHAAHAKEYDRLLGTATGSHMPSVNMQISHMMHRNREKIKMRYLTLLHLDNIPADMDDMEGTSVYVKSKEESVDCTDDVKHNTHVDVLQEQEHDI